MAYRMLTLLTSLGNPGLLLALSAAVAVALLLAGRACGRVAALWLGAVGACFVLVSTLKICLISCGQLWLPGIDLQSPSGHAAGSMVVYGGLAVLLRTQMPGRAGRLILLAGPALATAIGISRALLSLHSWPEVLVGWAVGSLCAAGFAWTLSGTSLRLSFGRLSWLALAGLVLLAADLRIGFEHHFQALSRDFSATTRVCSPG